MDKQKLTEGDVNFFNTFGYILLPGLVKDDIDWITDEFTMVFKDAGIVHDPAKRTHVVPFIDRREKLATLLDHPAVEGAIASLVGDDFNYLHGDGNYYTGDSGWHPDGNHAVGAYVKAAFYLDPVDKDTGCLRVIPGSHLINAQPVWEGRLAPRAKALWGIEPRDVPCVPLVSQPGDVVIFNHNLLHAAFGGGTSRRMFTMNCGRRAETPEEFEELRQYVIHHCHPYGERAHTEIMRSTAGAGRMVHLRQVFDAEASLK